MKMSEISLFSRNKGIILGWDAVCQRKKINLPQLFNTIEFAELGNFPKTFLILLYI